MFHGIIFVGSLVWGLDLQFIFSWFSIGSARHGLFQSWEVDAPDRIDEPCKSRGRACARNASSANICTAFYLVCSTYLLFFMSLLAENRGALFFFMWWIASEGRDRSRNVVALPWVLLYTSWRIGLPSFSALSGYMAAIWSEHFTFWPAVLCFFSIFSSFFCQIKKKWNKEKEKKNYSYECRRTHHGLSTARTNYAKNAKSSARSFI